MGIISSVLSNVLYFTEKITFFLTWTVLVTCLVATILAILALGIGLGYNYCFVDLKTRYRYVPPRYQYPHSRLSKSGSQNSASYHDPNAKTSEDEAMQSHTDFADDDVDKFNSTANTYNITEDATLNETALERASSTDSDTQEPEILQVSSTPLPKIIRIDGMDVLELLTKLKAENKSYSLQIVTS